MGTRQHSIEIIVRQRKTGDGIRETERELDNFGKRLNSTIDVIGKSTAAAVAAGATFKKAFDLAKQGAELRATEERFDRLAESIGTTGDALEKDLGTAMRGMATDAEALAAATDFLTLGLAKSHDEAVRMTAVAGALNMDMNQLILTLTNQTTARFDQLGVPVDGFKEKVEELKEAGMDADAAFKEAFLQQAEAQIDRVGHSADLATGSFEKFEVQIKNVGDALLVAFSERNEGTIGGMANTLEILNDRQAELQDLLDRGIISQKEYNIATIANWTGNRNLTDIIEELNLEWEEQLRLMEELARTSGAYSFDQAKLAQGQAMIAAETAQANEAMAAHAEMMDRIRERINEANEGETQWLRHRELVNEAWEDTAEPVQDLLQAQRDLAEAQGEWVETTRNNAREVGNINSQLAGDLTDETRRAMQEQLSTVEEGSAEWLAIYNALQNDLTDSQRAALIAQRAELEGSAGELINVYTGDARAAEEAQERIAAANDAIVQSYREVATEAILAQMGVTEASLQLLVSIGQMTQEEANLRLEVANTTAAIQELTESEEFAALSTKQQAEALNALINGQVSTAESALNLANMMDSARGSSDDLRGSLEETAGTYTAEVLLKDDDAKGRLANLDKELGKLDGKVATAVVRIREEIETVRAEEVGSTPGGGGRQHGGSVSGRSAYRVGEGNRPELFRSRAGLFMIPGEDGNVFSHDQSRGMMGGGIKIEGGVHISIDGAMVRGNPQRLGNMAATAFVEKIGEVTR